MTDLDIRRTNDLNNAFLSADVMLNKSYLPLLNNDAVVIEPLNIDSKSEQYLSLFNSHIRFYDVTKIVLNKSENMREKLISVFNAIGNTGASLLMLVEGKEDRVSLKFGVKVNDKSNIGAVSDLLDSAFKGNFPGTSLTCLKKDALQDCYQHLPTNGYVTAVSAIAGKRTKEENKEHLYVQGLEKVIDTLQGKEYSLLLIADAITLQDLNASKKALEELYSTLVPFSESQYTIGKNESQSLSSSITEGVTETINSSISHNTSHTVGINKTITEGTSRNTNITPGSGRMALIGTGIGAAIGSIFPGAGTLIGAGIGAGIGIGIGGMFSFSNGKNHSETNGTSSNDTVGTSETEGHSTSNSKNETKGLSDTTGTSDSLQIKFENYSVKQILKRIDEDLKRYDECADLGMWNCAMYCIAKSSDISNTAASVYHSVIRGEKSSLENGAIISWDEAQSQLVMNHLRMMEHPKLNLGNLSVTPGTMVSTAELAMEAALPNHSLPGIPVLECAEFGRNVSSYDSEDCAEDKFYSVALGNIFHMQQKEELAVNLNPKSLTSHTFITGSTGSGKSNTVYQILNECLRIGHKFMVIEPAKGEYKNVFGNKATVYGTNPNLSRLLRINPFSFPKEIHILEHLDRLIEIFNVCWPMYAAMPAVLKEAVEKSYEDAGWDLTESSNKYGNDYYPTFSDVTRNIKTIIDSSEYDAENKGAYKGSLITRLKSLSNGINGLLFTTDEIPNEELFDKNVIVDLSRVGSSETKSLIMGLLVLKLQEYRITSNVMNSDLKHLTVLEEAHNLLKKTSTEQSQDSGNLAGKSVEMLTNAIAEMRTYGEGFIIADQAPGLLDKAVIRNTNTKIIMRLPDLEDRELVGKAANLNDNQIKELAKLPLGVAAVYQNEWVEPVLCQISKADVEECGYKYDKPVVKKSDENFITEKLEIAKLLCNGTAVTNENEKIKLLEKLDKLNLDAVSKVFIMKSVEHPFESPRFTKIAPVISKIFPNLKSGFIDIYNRTSDVKEWSVELDKLIKIDIDNIEYQLRNDIIQCIITEYVNNEIGKVELLQEWQEGGVL